jgi:hypothetical protein
LAPNNFKVISIVPEFKLARNVWIGKSALDISTILLLKNQGIVV